MNIPKIVLILTRIPGKPFKVLRNSGIPQDLESAGFESCTNRHFTSLNAELFIHPIQCRPYRRGGIFSSIAQSMQSLQKVGPNSTLCNCCNPKKAARQVRKRACNMQHPTCNLSHNAIATKVAQKIAWCSSSCSTFCNDCSDFLKPLQFAAQDCKV